MIDYIEIMQEYYGDRADGFLTDKPVGIKLAEDDQGVLTPVKVRYDTKSMRWIPSRPSRIKYPTARKLIKQYRKEYAEKWGV